VFFRLMMVIAGSMLVATASMANAKAAPGYLHTNLLDKFPQTQMQESPYRAMCPLIGVSNSHQDDVADLDLSHLYDWAQPIETLEARDTCAMPAPDPDVFENIG